MTSLAAQTLPFADAWGMHDGDVGVGWWVAMTFGMLFFWGAVVAVVVWALRGGASSSRASAAPASSAPESLRTHVSECAQLALGQRVDPPAVTCVHEGHVHSFATFGELVAHLRERHG